MDPLIEELTTRGVLDPQTLDLARAYQAERGINLESALLELDLIDEDGLLSGLEACYGMQAARPSDLARAEPNAGSHLPQGAAKSFGLCPVRFEDNALICFVQSPLPKESVLELRELFGLIAQPLLAPAHYSNLVRSVVYGTPLSETTRALEARLAERRAIDVRQALAELEHGESLSAMTEHVIGFAQHFFDFSCFFVFKDRRLRVGASSSAYPAPGGVLPEPDADCQLRPAILHGGFFFGPISDTGGSRRFYASLRRPLPRWAFVAPARAAGGSSVVFYADNAERGIAPPRVAELTLLVARLGGRGRPVVRREPYESTMPNALGSDTQEPEVRAAGRQVPTPRDSKDFASPTKEPATVEQAIAAPRASQSGAPSIADEPLTTEELDVLQRLRALAGRANMKLSDFVDELLRQRSNEAGTDAAAALVAEVKGLFDRLATDIPSHFARGIEGAFRDLGPRLAAQAPPPVAQAPPATHATPAATAPQAAPVQVVAKESAAREVPDYKSRRRKSARVKL
jgi:hypothetical protein